MPPQEIIERIREGGNAGMGGAAFPTHVKLSPPPDKKIDVLLINGAECEPFLTADHRMMLEQTEKIIYGVKIIMKALNVRRAVVGIEDNKPDAIARMSQAVDVHGIRVKALETKYPQGAEKQLIETMTGRQTPSGGLPMDVGVVVVNVSSAAAVADCFLTGEPLIRRVVTVTGDVISPQNLLVRIGTSTQAVIDYVGGFDGEPRKIISGGPMMGLPVPTTDCVITKGYSGVLVLGGKLTKAEKERFCIRCGKCVDACPIHLLPSQISEASAGEDFERAEAFHAMDCMSCGSCSYVCPAKKPVAQNIKFAKEMITMNRVREREQRDREAANG
jgi:electron transport complex protein RnfC